MGGHGRRVFVVGIFSTSTEGRRCDRAMRQVREVHQPQVWDSRVDRSGITKHINDIFESGELEELSNVQKMHISSTKPTNTSRQKQGNTWRD